MRLVDQSELYIQSLELVSTWFVSNKLNQNAMLLIKIMLKGKYCVNN